MAKIVYKVAPRCGGKTKWLCCRANEELENKNTVFYFTNEERMIHFKSFKEKYEYFFGESCNIDAITNIDDIPKDVMYKSAILIDNFMEYHDGSQFVHSIKDVEGVVIYITLNDDCIPARNKIEDFPDAQNWEQLTLW